jgi:3-deoxy-D-manno-octulosonic-acid transferase
MPYLLNLLYLLALLTLSPWLVYKVLTTGKYRHGMRAKVFGWAVARLGGRPCVWFHGVSVGEVHLLRQVVAAFRQRHPDWDVVISTTTETGFDEARKHFSPLPVFYWPLDFSWAVEEALSRVSPDLVVLAEGELWPNFLRAARARGVPVAVINGRLSPRSFRRYRWLGSLASRWLSGVDLLAVQTEDYAASFRALGAKPARVQVTGSVKFDGVTADRRNPRTQGLRRLLGVEANDLIWIAGSTQSPEEALVLELFHRVRPRHPNLRLIVVPRQKERFDEVAAELRGGGQPFVRRSELTAPVTDRNAVVLMDTIGELGALWGLADVAFVGGSLDGRRGGQNMLEPAAYGAAVVFGPHVWNFRDTAARLIEAGAAIQVADADQLDQVVRRLLGDPRERRLLGTAAQQFVLSQQGATARTIDCLDRLLAAKGSGTLAA